MSLQAWANYGLIQPARLEDIIIIIHRVALFHTHTGQCLKSLNEELNKVRASKSFL